MCTSQVWKDGDVYSAPIENEKAAYITIENESS